MPAAFLSEDERARVQAMGSEGEWLLGKAESAMQELQSKVTSLQADLDAEKSNTGAAAPRRARQMAIGRALTRPRPAAESQLNEAEHRFLSLQQDHEVLSNQRSKLQLRCDELGA